LFWVQSGFGDICVGWQIGGFLENDNPGGWPMGACFSRQMELFVDGAPQPLAGFPNRQVLGAGFRV
jgi:hypothetical protein